MDRRVQGRVFVLAVVEIDGTIGATRVERTIDPSLDAEALRSVKKWRFTPGTYNGVPAPMVVSIERSFTLKQ